MAQHDYVIANASGATVRADINNMALAISSNNSGSSAPSTTYAYLWWLDTSANLLKLRNSANNAWITMPFSITANNTVDINGGTIDGTNIGASSAGTGAFTTLNASGLAQFDSRAGIGVAPHGTAALNITTTNQHIRLNNGSELGVISLLSSGELDLSAHGDGETINFRTGTGTGTVVMAVVGTNVGIGETTPLGKLHVKSGDSGASSVNVNANELVIENADYTGITILGENETSIMFGDNEDPDVGRIEYFHSSNNMSFRTNASDRMLIDSSGNVGIGTTNPQAKLHVAGTVRFSTTSGDGTETRHSFTMGGSADPGIYQIADGAQNTKVQLHAAGDSFFGGGNVAIYAGNFYVSGEGTNFSAGSHNGNLLDDNGQSLSSRAATNNQTHKSFYNPNGAVGSITTNGNNTAFNTSSDYRLKENVVTDWDGTTLLKQLKPSKFNFKADTDTTIQGFLAHEVSSIVPQAISGEKDAVYTAEEAAEDITAVEGQPNYQSIDHSKLVPLLVKTIQELEARITSLEG